MRQYINVLTYDRHGNTGNAFMEYSNIPATFYDFRQKLGKNDDSRAIYEMFGEYLDEKSSGTAEKTDAAFYTAESHAAQNRQVATYLRIFDGKTSSWNVMKNGEWKQLKDSIYENRGMKYTRKQICEAIRFWKKILDEVKRD